MPRTTKKRTKRGHARTKRRGWRTASTSDIHDLYERSVQEPDAEGELIDQVWREQRDRLATSIREDFCGTAAASMAWVRRRRANTAIAVDIDPAVLDWGRQRLRKRLTPSQARRLTLVEGDVMKTLTKPVDSVLAMNFSYFIFRTRPQLKRYFRCAHHALRDDGLFLLDAYGGGDSYSEMEEERDFDSFTYIWDQAHFNPITHDVTNHIHYSFPDGTRIDKAFTYHWRIWTLPELQELLKEAGFRTVSVYWEGTDEKTNEGNNEWSVSTRGEACPAWIAYLCAGK